MIRFARGTVLCVRFIITNSQTPAHLPSSESNERIAQLGLKQIPTRTTTIRCTSVHPDVLAGKIFQPRSTAVAHRCPHILKGCARAFKASNNNIFVRFLRNWLQIYYQP